EEFLILMPETDNEAAKVVERLEEAIKVWNKESDLDCQIDLSIGVSSWSPQEERRIEEVLEEADQRMYRNKLNK
nr:diguanylate cyclase [Desulfobacterales bacterium]